MLYPINTETRMRQDLNGVWDFIVDEEKGWVDPNKPLEDPLHISVPASLNDQVVNEKVKQHVGYFWYQTELNIPKVLKNERKVLRFGSVTHEAWVYLNGEELGHHKGGFTPFEFDITDVAKEGTNLLSVRVSNMLDYTSLPVGNYSETRDEEGNLVRHVDENFDFYNYAGIHRPVVLYTTGDTYIDDIVITPDIASDLKSAEVDFDVVAVGEHDEVKIEILNEDDQVVATNEKSPTTVSMEDINLWWPLNAYLYTARVQLIKDGEVVDVYNEPFGLRTVEVKDAQFLINNEPFYFKGFGKHEDANIIGKALDNTLNVHDINLMKKMGANSFRTSHYPYAEEMMRLCDREGIVVTDETTAVGVFHEFSAILESSDEPAKDTTFEVMETAEAHCQVIKELIARDKNHACVVIWSIANEPAQHALGAYEYFKPLMDLARELDPQKRPLTIVNIFYATPENDLCTELVDVISLNRYYGWYLGLGDLETAAKNTYNELKLWNEKHPDKPVMYTEYGVDTVSGLHSNDNAPYTEEFQLAYYEMNHRIFDQMPHFIGEQLWNFADFQTKYDQLVRIQGNKKGVFTRSRKPKMVVNHLTERWNEIPDFNYKKDN